MGAWGVGGDGMIGQPVVIGDGGRLKPYWFFQHCDNAMGKAEENPYESPSVDAEYTIGANDALHGRPPWRIVLAGLVVTPLVLPAVVGAAGTVLILALDGPPIAWRELLDGLGGVAGVSYFLAFVVNLPLAWAMRRKNRLLPSRVALAGVVVAGVTAAIVAGVILVESRASIAELSFRVVVGSLLIAALTACPVFSFAAWLWWFARPTTDE